MTAPVPEETNAAEDLTEAPADEHGSDLPGDRDGDQVATATQDENAESSLDQPSQ